MELIGSNVVIAAHHFNPWVLSQAWLIRQHIVEESEFEKTSAFGEGVSQAHTARFKMLVVPEMIQFALNLSGDPTEERPLIIEKLGRIVRELPHTPYHGIGLNFVWQEAAASERVVAMSKRMFVRPDVMPFREFNTPDARFGGYLSKDFKRGLRLKLDIKPMRRELEGQTEEGLMFSFNFHRDLVAENAVRDIQDTLELWDDAKHEARALVAATVKGGD